MIKYFDRHWHAFQYDSTAHFVIHAMKIEIYGKTKLSFVAY